MRSADLPVLEAYCQAYARWRAAEAWLSENGQTVVLRDENGLVKYVQQVPQVAIAKAERAAMLKCAAELGVTPASRSNVEADGPGEDSEAASLLS